MKLVFAILGLVIFFLFVIFTIYFNLEKNIIWCWLIPIIIIILFLSLFLAKSYFFDNDEMSIYKGGGDRIWEDIENNVPYEKSYAKQLHDSFKK